MKGSMGKAFPVTIDFKGSPDFIGEMSLSDVREKLGTDSDSIPLLEMTTQSIVILSYGTNEIVYARNFLEYVNQISHHKHVMPQLYDAGYIPYLMMPQLHSNTPIQPPCLPRIFKTAAEKAGVPMIMQRNKYFEDSSTSAAYVTYWVTRADAARVINLYGGRRINPDNPTETDKITSIEVFDAIVQGGLLNDGN